MSSKLKLVLGNFLTLLTFSIVLLNYNNKCACAQNIESGILYPQDSESRETKILDGIWNFRISPKIQQNNSGQVSSGRNYDENDVGFLEEWFNRPLELTGDVIHMPVPSSYNDITQNKTIRDHVGWAWYDRQFRIPKGWSKERIFIRFGSVSYHAIVWINGIKILEHSGGHMAFSAEIDPILLNYLHSNRITVAVNNTLTDSTVPQGKTTFKNDARYPKGYFTLDYSFDFFNYAGIHRPVYLYTTPVNHIDDIDVVTSFTGTTGYVDYTISLKSKSFQNPHDNSLISVCIQDKQSNPVGNCVTGSSGKITVPNVNLWWPYTMVKHDSDAGYLYTLVVKFSNEQSELIDIYRLKFGIRTINFTNKEFFINNKPFYFRGFGRHEDNIIRGKGYDPVMTIKDANLIKWIGANSYRTSHYPYAEEIMDLADELGIVIIDECPAVSLDGFSSELLKNHKQSIREMIRRDKNRPSVVLWSVGNEPQSQKTAAEAYFRQIVDYTKALDTQRPLTMVTNQGYYNDLTVQYMDIISINRYFSWYSDTGHTEVIEKSMVLDVQNWVKKFNKPVIVAEYGADTIAGLHSSPEFVFTEEYQLELLKDHFKAFDFLRANTSFIGEHVWNFADFMTNQGITRVVGNRKGIFTRERQPKASAHYMRHRYFLLASAENNYPVPDDIKDIVPIYSHSKNHIEL